MSSTAPLAPRRPSPFQRLLRPRPFRGWLASQGNRRVSSAELINAAPVAAAPLLDEMRRGRFIQLCEIAHGFGLHVAPEVSLGALFTLGPTKDQPGLEDAAKALRSKRVDFVLIDGAAQPVLAMDYRGDGAWRGRALRRDRLKRRVFERAGIPLIDLGGPAEWEDDRAHILQLLRETSRPVRRDRPAA